MRHQHGVVGKGVKGRQHGKNVGLAQHHVGADAVDGDGCRWYLAPRVHQLVDAFVPEQLAVEHAHRADLDDLVALGRVEAGGFGVEHGERQIGQRHVVERLAARADAKEVEIVELGPAVAAHVVGAVELLLRRCGGQQKAKPGLVAGAVALQPEGAAVAIDHLAHRQCAGLGADAHRVDLPAHHGLGAQRGAAPDQVQLGLVGPLARGAQAQAEVADGEFVAQARRQKQQRLHDREALDAQPQVRVGLALVERDAQRFFDAPPGGAEQVAAEHVFERPAALKDRGRLAAAALHARA